MDGEGSLWLSVAQKASLPWYMFRSLSRQRSALVITGCHTPPWSWAGDSPEGPSQELLLRSRRVRVYRWNVDANLRTIAQDMDVAPRGALALPATEINKLFGWVLHLKRDQEDPDGAGMAF